MEITSLSQQLGYLYARNKHYKQPLNIYLTGVNGALKDKVERMGGLQWLLNVREESFEEEAVLKS